MYSKWSQQARQNGTKKVKKSIWVSKTASGAPRRWWGRPKMIPRGLKTSLERRQESPGGLKMLPRSCKTFPRGIKRLQDVSKRPQDVSQEALRRLQEVSRCISRGAKTLPRGLKTPRRSIFDEFRRLTFGIFSKWKYTKS